MFQQSSTNNAYLWYDLRKEVWRLYTKYERTYTNVPFLLQTLRLERINTVYVADLKIASYFLLEHMMVTKIKASRGNYYSFRGNDMRWISVDHIFRRPFWILAEELDLGEPCGKAVKKLVNIINDISGLKLGREFLTIGQMAWKLLEGFEATNGALDQKYYSNDKMYKWFKERNIYRGGLCLLNKRYAGKTMNNIYKYDKNSFFSYIMKYGKMPLGRYKICAGKPTVGFEDRLIHCKWTAKAHFDGLAPYEDKEFFLEEDLWIYGCELQELMNWYDTLSIEYIEYMVFERSEPDKQFGRFIDYYYPQKKTAKGAHRQLIKLILNNIYGKFGQCPYKTYIKQVGNQIVENNPKTFLDFEQAKTHSLAVAAKITALARTKLMRDIREATNNRPDIYYIYGDTDSMILTIPFEGAGDELGQFKFEGRFNKGKVLGKKCYMLYDGSYECHACGVNRDVLEQEMKDKTWQEADARFNYGEVFMCPTFVDGKIGLRPRALSRGFEKTTLNTLYDVYEGE